ncbi:MAG: Type IV secretion system protein virB5 [Steroidobacteraceae bacterium]|nr:Type IV secretion system protein virB5 [Steroidobacteraceae bacterium]
MTTRHTLWITLLLASGLMAAAPSQAAMAVIDVSAIAQMVRQLNELRTQISVLRDQLQQARNTHASFTGNRGMQGLGLTAREYLPPDYAELERVLLGTSHAYAGLAQEIEALARDAGVLTNSQLTALGAQHREDVESQRRDTALQQALSRSALEASQRRFTALEQLRSTMPSATDPKAMMDLQARLQLEQAALANEAIKLQALREVAAADREARARQMRERAAGSLGSLRTLPPMGL